MSQKLYLFCILALGIVFIVISYKNLISDESSRKYHSFRQILQIRFDPLEKKNSVTLNKFYVRPIKNNTGNIPDLYFISNSKKPSKLNNTCAKFPDLFGIQFRNDYWQLQKTSNGSFFLFNAYLDQRNGSSVRIVAMYDQYPSKIYFYCQLWYNNTDKPVIKRTKVPFWLFSVKWGAENKYFDHPYIITCPVELVKNQLPFAVSLVEKPCDNATNVMKIFHKKVEKKKNFVVCVKGLNFPFSDKSIRLAEWIELLNLLGAEKINFYEFNVHPNSKRLLDYYEDLGLVEVTPITLLEHVSNNPILQTLFLHKKMIHRRLQEVIPYNDCLYKHLNEFKFVVLLDTDEIIMPRENTWVELIDTLQKIEPNRSSYLAQNVYFLDNHLHQHGWFEDIPNYMHMLQHVIRAKNYTKPGYFVKGFHDTRKVEGLHNHFPFRCLNGCNHFSINVSLAHLQHYRADCVGGVGNCDEMKKDSIMDTRIWNFKEALIERVNRVMAELELSNN